MFNIVLFQPQIAPNTGNLMRLVANNGCHLHLIEPLGFELDDTKLRRAGLDYRDLAQVSIHSSLECLISPRTVGEVYAFSSKADQCFSSMAYKPGDFLIFGPETTGLPADVLKLPEITERVKIPFLPSGRSLNLANAVAIASYEAWRQNGYSNPPGQRATR